MGIFQKSNFKRKIELVELADIFISDMKLTRNDIVMINSSLRKFNLADSQLKDLIYFLKMIVGTEGALLIQSHTDSAFSDPETKLPQNIASSIYRDLLKIEFPQMIDIIKIGKPSELFSVWGKTPKYFKEDHSGNEFESGNKNLLYKLSLLKAKIIGLGVPFADLTFLNISDTYFPLSQDIILKYFKEDELRFFIKRGIQYYWVDAEKVYQRALLLVNNRIGASNLELKK
jgi:aminoglycoside N3'-acetyltransferase